jgi:hypothetical protein
MIDLFAIASENATAVAEAFDAVCVGLAPEDLTRLVRYADRVQEEGRISINMRQDVLNSFLIFREHRNMYEWAGGKAAESGRPREEILHEKLDVYYEPRITFDRSFEDGERFRYGALQIGGLGASSYGEFCVVLQESVSSGREQVAYLRSDSLKTYMLPGPALDEISLRRDASPHAHRHHLAAIKHAEEVPGCPEDDWPELLCSPSDCVEAIFTGAVNPADVEVVRMPRKDHDFRYRHAFQFFRGKLDKADHILVADFAIAHEQLKNFRIDLEPIEDAATPGVST